MAGTSAYLVLTNGEWRKVTGEAGKYWICGDTQIRKINRSIVRVETAADEAEPEAKLSGKKQTARKKKAEE